MPFFALLSDIISSLFTAWSNISKHALNSAMAIFEIGLTNIGPLPWIDMPVTVLILGGYLGVAYITHATQGIYSTYLSLTCNNINNNNNPFLLAYSFLDPKKEGKLLAAYIVGIAVGQCIIFSLVTGLIYLREWLSRHKKRYSTALLGVIVSRLICSMFQIANFPFSKHLLNLFFWTFTLYPKQSSVVKTWSLPILCSFSP